MRTRLICTAVGVAIAAWGIPGMARETVALPGVVGPVGVATGVDTTGPGALAVGTQNINTSNDPGGGITSNAASTATINFGGSSTVTGFVGTLGANFLVINAGVAGTIVNFNGAVNTATYNLTGTGTINFNGGVIGAGNFAGDGFIILAAGQSMTGALITAAAGTGTLTLNGGSSVTGAIGGASGLRMINLVGGNAAVTGAVQSAGFSLGANTLTITGALTTNAGGTIATTLASNAVFGRITPSGASNINAGGITVTPTVTGVLTTGTIFRIVDAGSGTIGAPVFVVNNNPRYTFAGVPTVAGIVDIRLAGSTPLVNLVTTPAAVAVAPILDIAGPPGSNLLTIQNAIAALPNAAAINNALQQFAPASQNLAAPWVAAQATTQFNDLLMARVEEIQNLCCDDCGPNRAQVDTRKCIGPDNRSNWWGKTYAKDGTQGDRDGAFGYKSQARGLVLAYDKPLGDRTRAGLGVHYSNGTVDGNNSSGRMNIDSYQAMGYVSHAAGPWFVQGSLSAGRDNYDGSRNINFPGVSRTATASYSGSQYSGMVRTGIVAYAGQITLTPFASLQYSRINVDGYTEQGASGVDLQVQNQKYNFAQSGLGVKAESIVRSASGTFAPEVHVKWLHDFKATTMRETAAFTSGGAQFSTQGITQDRDMYNAGAGLTILSCNCDNKAWTVKGLYDHHWNNSNYKSHQVSLIASIKF